MPRYEIRNTSTNARTYVDAALPIDPMLYVPAAGTYRSRVMSDEATTDQVVPTLTVSVVETSPAVGSTVTGTTNAPSGMTWQGRRNGTTVTSGVVGTDALQIPTTGYTAGDTMTFRVFASGAQDVTSAGVNLVSGTLYTKIGDYSPSSGTTVTLSAIIPDVGSARKYIVQFNDESGTVGSVTCTIAGVTATAIVDVAADSLAVVRVFTATVGANTPGNVVFTRGTSIANPRARVGWVPNAATITTAVTTGGSAQNGTMTVSQAVGAGSAVLVGSAHRSAGSQTWTSNVEDVWTAFSSGVRRATMGVIPNTSAGTETITITESSETESRRNDAYSIEITP